MDRRKISRKVEREIRIKGMKIDMKQYWDSKSKKSLNVNIEGVSGEQPKVASIQSYSTGSKSGRRQTKSSSHGITTFLNAKKISICYPSIFFACINSESIVIVKITSYGNQKLSISSYFS